MAAGLWKIFIRTAKQCRPTLSCCLKRICVIYINLEYGDGLLVNYYPNGLVAFTQEYRNGKEEGGASLYDNNGVLRVRDWYEQGKDTGHTQFFDADGKKNMESLNGSEERYWYANGQFAVVVPKGSEEPTQAWREDGAAVTDMEEIQSIR